MRTLKKRNFLQSPVVAITGPGPLNMCKGRYRHVITVSVIFPGSPVMAAGDRRRMFLQHQARANVDVHRHGDSRVTASERKKVGEWERKKKEREGVRRKS
ncbi:hypothetical protein C0Q70_02615 [Pomacea canaliculata]|uniref:Uncharacterized protein n=1 Tax=Pomacea canaliculata TaxID=400727 RepID=A0A2T7PQE7_POMCA|nr:hypothetical protein C0Q70_02615 [Pomacea canaliculata]